MYRNLRALMVQKGIHQKELAELLKMNPSTLSSRMNSKSEWTKNEIDILIQLFGKSYEEIFFTNEINKMLIRPA